MKIHPTAIIHLKAELAEGVVIGPYAVIGERVTIGKDTVIGPHCHIEGRSILGEGNKLCGGSQVGIPSQDRKHKAGLIGKTVIGNHNELREHVTISASTLTSYDDEHRVTSVGDNCLFMAYSHVAHDCHVGNGVTMANCASLSGHVDVEDHATLAGLTGVHQECVVGRFSFVGGLTRVNMDVPPFMLLEGNPARCCGPNTIGLRRHGFDEEARRRIKNIYRIFFRSDLNTTQALHEIEARIQDSDEKTVFIDFVRQSIRGITR